MAQTRGGFNFDISGALKKLDDLQNNINEASMDLALELSEDGAVVARRALGERETAYGRYRMENGRGVSAGRINSGRMFNKLRALRPKKVGKSRVRAEVGWYYANEYFKYQERGTGIYATDPDSYDPNFSYQYDFGAEPPRMGIVGAHSLWTARAWMEKNFSSYRQKFINRTRGGMKK